MQQRLLRPEGRRRPALLSSAPRPWDQAHPVLLLEGRHQSLPRVLRKQPREPFHCPSPCWVLAPWDRGPGLGACRAGSTEGPWYSPLAAQDPLPLFLRGPGGWGRRERWLVGAAPQAQPQTREAGWRPRLPGGMDRKKGKLAEAWLTTGQKPASALLPGVLKRSAETRNVPLTPRF